MHCRIAGLQDRLVRCLVTFPSFLQFCNSAICNGLRYDYYFEWGTVELERPTTVTALLSQLEIDPRRVAVEHNIVVLKRSAFDDTLLQEGDQVEIVNFVGGG